MDSKKINFIWAICLFAIGVTMMTFVGVHLAGIGLSDIVVRICGAVDLVLLPVFTFLTVKKVKNRK